MNRGATVIMHEFGIAQGLLDVVLAKMNDAGAERIDRIRMEIGILSGVEQEALQFAFSALSEDTPAAGAELILASIPVRCFCPACNDVFECKPLAYRCPACGAASSEIRSGKEMNLVAMEVS